MASPGLDPRQVVNEEINDKRMEDLRNQNFNGNLEEGITGLKKLANSFTASGSNIDGVNSNQLLKPVKLFKKNLIYLTII